jgi:hypothetical protein
MRGKGGCVSTKDKREDAEDGPAFSLYSGERCKGFRQLITAAPATMHAGTAEGGGGADDEPDPDPASYFEEQCEDVGEEETAASASVDVRLDDEAADGKPSARAAASAKGPGGDGVVKRKKPKPKHQRSQKPEGYPSRNRYVRESCAVCIDRPTCRSSEGLIISPYTRRATLRRSSYNYFFQGEFL